MMRLKFRLLTVGNRGDPGSTLRRMRGQKAWDGHREEALEPAKEKKQGRRIMQPETKFLRQENFANGKRGTSREADADSSLLLMRGKSSRRSEERHVGE